MWAAAGEVFDKGLFTGSLSPLEALGILGAACSPGAGLGPAPSAQQLFKLKAFSFGQECWPVSVTLTHNGPLCFMLVTHSPPSDFQFLLADLWHDVFPRLFIFPVSLVMSLGGAPKS